jgi:outer membrane protein TolC
LTADRAVLQLRARQFAASVALIKAIGGGWDASHWPPPDAQDAASSSSDSTIASQD